MENLLRANAIDYLAVSSRVKDLASAMQKVKRKNYKDPSGQLTDLSGVRVIVFFESEVQKVSDLIRKAFCVDDANSSNKDSSLSVNQIGYRSVHFVCELGQERASLPEYHGLGGLKFEFQVRTVLQHAWAELAHDRNYKFSGKLPDDVERRLYLYAGMLELADKGFDELSREIDAYVEEVQREVGAGDLDMEINSINLLGFVEGWVRSNNLALEHVEMKDGLGDLVEELRFFGVRTLSELHELIPEDYARRVAEISSGTTIYGFVRDWMLLSDWRRYSRDVPQRWSIGLPDDEENAVVRSYLSDEEYKEFLITFGVDYGDSDH
ncbi:GTP pyrophosphokinase [Pseudomonas monteilii]|uniref:GTP pyrophosphokinase n=1 Tax=Pseudomonas monteilii TaxID=76759 RepID=UPI0036E0EBFF